MLLIVFNYSGYSEFKFVFSNKYLYRTSDERSQFDLIKYLMIIIIMFGYMEIYPMSNYHNETEKDWSNF
jgi:hypothetical protein